MRLPYSGFALLQPIYDYLLARGYQAKGEFVYIEGLPVQFLPIFNPLIDEAVSKAQTIKYGRVETRIMRAEHLVAIMLDTGRKKDYARINMFLEQGSVNMRSLKAALRRHDLVDKWQDNEHKFIP